MMDAIRLDGSCEIEEMTVSQLPVPRPRPGWLRVRVEAFGINAWDLPASVLQEVFDAVKAGEMSVPIARVFRGLEQVPDAHRAIESHAVPGKNVVVLG